MVVHPKRHDFRTTHTDTLKTIPAFAVVASNNSNEWETSSKDNAAKEHICTQLYITK